MQVLLAFYDCPLWVSLRARLTTTSSDQRWSPSLTLRNKVSCQGTRVGALGSSWPRGLSFHLV